MHRDRENDTDCMMTKTRPRTLGLYLAACCLVAASAMPAQAVSDRKIEDARYACDSFMKGEKKQSRRKDMERAQVARFWVLGFLTGAFEADAVLEFTTQVETAEGNIVSRVKEFCASKKDMSIHAAAVHTGESPQPLPEVTNFGLNPRHYSCAAYSAGRESRGDEKDRAKAAEFWVFAFVQGNMSVRYHSRLVVSISDKRKIVRALKRSCDRNPTRTLLDQTAEIASRVRPEWDRGDWD